MDISKWPSFMEGLKGRTDRGAMKRGRGLIRVDAFRCGFDTILLQNDTVLRLAGHACGGLTQQP